MNQRLWKTTTSTFAFSVYRRAYSQATRCGGISEHCCLPSPVIDVGLGHSSHFHRLCFTSGARTLSCGQCRISAVTVFSGPRNQRETDVTSRNSVAQPPSSEGGVQTMQIKVIESAAQTL